MMINVLRCPRNVGVVANNKQLNASSNRCSGTSRTIKNNTKNSRRRKGVVISSFGEAYNLSFFYLFVFLLLRPSSVVLASRERKKTFEFSPLVFFFFFVSEKTVLFRARAQTTTTSTALPHRHRPRSRIDLRGVLRARARERDLLLSHRARE